MKTYWPRADRDEFRGDHSLNQAELDKPFFPTCVNKKPKSTKGTL